MAISFGCVGVDVLTGSSNDGVIEVWYFVCIALVLKAGLILAD